MPNELNRINQQKKITKSDVRELVLIDNDLLIHATWKLIAKKHNHTLHCYKDVNSFLKDASQFSKNIEIYIDDDLELSQPGHLLAKNIFDLDFKNISLASGNKLEQLPYWINSEIGKNYPI